MIKKCKVMLALCLMFMLTGCVKFNANMDIKKNKSMNFGIIYAVDTSYFGELDLLDQEAKSSLEKNGYIVDDYSDGTLTGVNVYKKIKSIDLVSVSEDVEFSLSSFFEDVDSSSKMFKVEKGFLKNRYVANITFDSNDSELGMDDPIDAPEDSVDDNNTNYYDDVEFDLENEFSDIDYGDISGDTSDTFDDMDMSGATDLLTSSLDMSFNVTLPYAAISNNATEVSDDGKSLKWVLTTDAVSSIEFEFELYNMTTIYAIVGAVVLVVVLIVFLVLKNTKKAKDKEVDFNQNNSFADNDNMFNNNASTNFGMMNNNMMSQMSEPVMMNPEPMVQNNQMQQVPNDIGSRIQSIPVQQSVPSNYNNNGMMNNQNLN